MGRALWDSRIAQWMEARVVIMRASNENTALIVRPHLFCAPPHSTEEIINNGKIPQSCTGSY